MLRIIKDRLEEYRESLKKRHSDFPLDHLLELDEKRRKLISEINNLRHEKNLIEEDVAIKMKAGNKEIDRERLKELDKKIKNTEKELSEIEDEINQLQLSMPNFVDPSVPEGTDESYNQVVRTWGEAGKVGPDHIEIGTKLDLIDVERAAKTSGARFYYLKRDLARLNYALISYGLDFGTKRGYTLLQPPYMLRRAILESAVDISAFEEAIYKIENEDLYLLTTAEHAILGYHYDEILDEKSLPLKYIGISPCFRKEAGAHGRDTKGIFRVHVFEKVEQFIYSKPEDSWKYHEELIKNAEEFFQSLGIPYRVVNVCSGELGAPAAKKYDLEVWLPGQNKYREAVSCSNTLEWQAVRAKIRYKKGNETLYVHTLNSTLVATERALIAIMENNYLPDGRIQIPKPLVNYMNGQEYIEPKKF
ncbi:MAG: serine--tRNA ligase [Nitrososphaeria archaeon]